MDFYSANFTLTWAYAKNLTIILPSGKLSGKLTVNGAYKQLAARIEKPPGKAESAPPPPTDFTYPTEGHLTIDMQKCPKS